MGSVRLIQVGLGPIGRGIVAQVAEREGMELVGAVDLDPCKVGRDAGTISGTERLGVEVSEDLGKVLNKEADVVVLATGSRLADVAPQVEMCVRAGKSVVSTCEELAFPFVAHPELARRMDELSREHGVAVLGTGINPGFLMDALPIFLTGICRRVEGVKVERFQDASTRRFPFQRKVGAGLSQEEFWEGLRRGSVGHVGFRESAHMIAEALGWRVERYEETVEPILAEEPLESRFVKVEPGRCAGLRQVGCGYVDGRRAIVLELQAYLGHPEPKDSIVVYGEPVVRWEVVGGVDGDVGTCSVVLNAARVLPSAPPGLRTMLDMPVIHWSRSA
ncbi:MAG: dihydrodipicolinate reductase [Candidatus Latescibacterota bacterium]|nr:MAG: dihydrodipicolinate reductase [Candidatus Latescibacterota bacterium]RKY71905.1 MAG: dihydrodipicolinate reductase [Candidatus Latescibacterota bacterium]HDH99539.1 dihydrodipicolinate reductase [Bacillota bacterium]